MARTPQRIEIAFRGWYAVAARIGILVVPQLLARSLEPAEAEALVRQRLVAEVTSDLLAERRSEGDAIPDAANARRWARELECVTRVRFRAVEVRRALLVPPFRRRTNFVVKATIEGEARSRYFWLFGTGPSSVSNSSRGRWTAPLWKGAAILEAP